MIWHQGWTRDLRLTIFVLWAFCSVSCMTIEPEPLEADPYSTVEAGKALYLVSCSACHQFDGKGLEGVAPPLSGTRWAHESEERLTRIILQGLRGPITVAGKKYNLEMPPMGFFKDHEVAEILTYVRTTWGNSSSSTDVNTIERIRAQTSDRSDSWTVEELFDEGVDY